MMIMMMSCILISYLPDTVVLKDTELSFTFNGTDLVMSCHSDGFVPSTKRIDLHPKQYRIVDFVSILQRQSMAHTLP